MNSMFTADTRPRKASGVANCTSDERMFTLTMSAAPMTNSADKDSTNDVESPNTIVATDRPRLQNIAGIDEQQGGCATQQDRHQIERDSSQQ